VKVAAQVLANGHIAHATAVENDTGSEPLGKCLAAEIGNWVLPPHAGEPVDILRPITFNPQTAP
jgi:hypothetical protein